MPFDLELDHDRGIPVYRQIYEAVLAALGRGELRRDERLPTIQELAARLRVNPNTVARAYKDLEREGHVRSHRGRGTFPAPARARPSSREREAVLRDIFHRAVAEGAKHALDAADIARYFRRAVDDDE